MYVLYMCLFIYIIVKTLPFSLSVLKIMDPKCQIFNTIMYTYRNTEMYLSFLSIWTEYDDSSINDNFYSEQTGIAVRLKIKGKWKLIQV